MPRPRGNGLMVRRAKSADGTVTEYFYNRHTKEALGKDRAAAEAKLAARPAAPAPAAPPAPAPAVREVPRAAFVLPGSFNELIADYKKTDKYKKLAANTKSLYATYLRQIQDELGNIPVVNVTAPWLERLKLRLQDQPAKANNTLIVMQNLMYTAVKLGYRPDNPALKIGRVSVDPRTQLWTEADETKFLAAVTPQIGFAFMLLLYTAQRLSDVLDMVTNRIGRRDGRLFLAVRQGKTKTLLDIPIHRNLAPFIEARLAESTTSPFLLHSPEGYRWNKRNFVRHWDAAMKMPGLQRRDLRRTAVVRMAESGLTTPQIAAITGHKIDVCQKIIDTYLPRRTEVAVSGMDAWERSGDVAMSNIVAIAARREEARIAPAAVSEKTTTSAPAPIGKKIAGVQGSLF